MTLRNDASRLRIPSRDPRAFRSLATRQGQVLLDSDIGQVSTTLLHRIERETVDSLKSAGRVVYPAGTTGFQITAGAGPLDFVIGDGHGYLDGWLLENPDPVTLATQPHPRSEAAPAAPAIIALKALVRHIDPVEDRDLADRALGDAQASGRELIDWQVFPLPVAAGGPPLDCAGLAQEPGWVALRAPSTGTMSVHKDAAAPSTNPCSLTPGGGYSRLQNLLYRVEVHDGQKVTATPDVDGPRFGLDGLELKFSRRNASLLAAVVQVEGATVRVAPPALNSEFWFAAGTYAEIVSIHDDVDPRAAASIERLFRVSAVDADKVTLDATLSEMTQTGVTAPASPNDPPSWFLRLWDAWTDDAGSAVVAVAGTDSQQIELGDGLSVQFHDPGAAIFRRGDYWTFSARADGFVDWPGLEAGTSEQSTPHGPDIRYAALAVMTADNPPAYENCSTPFGTLTDRLLFYRGGDGQSVFPTPALPFVPLTQPLRVAVMRGQTPVAGAIVRFAPVTGAPDTQIGGQACTQAQPVVAVTDANGLVEIGWALDRAKLHEVHRVSATLALSASEDLANAVEFNATFRTAKDAGYEPGACAHLTGVDNVQEALDTLCANLGQNAPPRSIGLTRITLRGGYASNPVETELIREGRILNGMEVEFNAFREWVKFGIDVADIDQLVFDELDPVAEITLDLPYPTTDQDRMYWMVVTGGHGQLANPFGFHQIRLDGALGKEIDGEGPVLWWHPSKAAQLIIDQVPRHWFGQALGPDRQRLEAMGWFPRPHFMKIPCRLRLRSALIWAKDPQSGEIIYLNAEHLGAPADAKSRPLWLKDRDPQRAADLDMFIFLKVHIG